VPNANLRGPARCIPDEVEIFEIPPPPPTKSKIFSVELVACPRAGLGRVLINSRSEVRFRGQTGKHLLTSRLTGFDLGHSLCFVGERRSVVMVNQREDLFGRVYATHDVVPK
jgi:hypothetical protein